jgi:uncharacterized RDD family membrane protein YckC
VFIPPPANPGPAYVAAEPPPLLAACPTLLAPPFPPAYCVHVSPAGLPPAPGAGVEVVSVAFAPKCAEHAVGPLAYNAELKNVSVPGVPGDAVDDVA